MKVVARCTAARRVSSAERSVEQVGKSRKLAIGRYRSSVLFVLVNGVRTRVSLAIVELGGSGSVE